MRNLRDTHVGHQTSDGTQTPAIRIICTSQVASLDNRGYAGCQPFGFDQQWRQGGSEPFRFFARTIPKFLLRRGGRWCRARHYDPLACAADLETRDMPGRGRRSPG